MNCNIDSSLLDGLIDDQLTTKEQLEINTHLIECSHCQAQLVLKRRSKTLIFEMEAPVMSDDFELGLQRKIAASKAQDITDENTVNVVPLNQSVQSRPKAYNVWLAAACAVIAVTSLSLITMKDSTQDAILALDEQPLIIEINTPVFAADDVQLASVNIEIDEQKQGFWTDNETDSFDQFTQVDSGYQTFSCGSTVGERACTLGPGKMVASLTVKSAI